MRIYISGPMTGIRDDNCPAFFAAAEHWTALGFDVVNPAESFGGRMDLPRAVYMRRDVELLLTCHAIVMLPGWEDSAGARLERAIAVELGLPVWEHDITQPARHASGGCAPRVALSGHAEPAVHAPAP